MLHESVLLHKWLCRNLLNRSLLRLLGDESCLVLLRKLHLLLLLLLWSLWLWVLRGVQLLLRCQILMLALLMTYVRLLLLLRWGLLRRWHTRAMLMLWRRLRLLSVTLVRDLLDARLRCAMPGLLMWILLRRLVSITLALVLLEVRLRFTRRGLLLSLWRELGALTCVLR